MRRPTTLLLSGLLALAPAVSAQHVRGRVLDQVSEEGVPDASVALVDVSGVVHGRVLSDSLGRYVLPLPGEAAFHIVVDALGYESGESHLLRAEALRDHRLDLVLAPEAVELAPLVVTADRVENWLRLEMGAHPASLGGKVLAGEELADLTLPGRDIVDVLRYANLPGAFVYRGPQGLCVVSRGGSCSVVRLNGMPIVPEALDAIDPAEIGAVVFLRDTDAADLFPRPGQRSGGATLRLYTRTFLPRLVGAR